MRNNRPELWFGLFSLAILIAGGTIFLNLNGKLENSQQQIQQLKEDKSTMKTEISSKNKEIDNLEEQLRAINEDIPILKQELAQKLAQVRKLQTGIETIGKCLEGILVLDQIEEEPSEEDFAKLLIMLPQLVESCEESNKILEEIEKAETSTRFSFLSPPSEVRY